MHSFFVYRSLALGHLSAVYVSTMTAVTKAYTILSSYTDHAITWHQIHIYPYIIYTNTLQCKQNQHIKASLIKHESIPMSKRSQSVSRSESAVSKSQYDRVAKSGCRFNTIVSNQLYSLLNMAQSKHTIQRVRGSVL